MSGSKVQIPASDVGNATFKFGDPFFPMTWEIEIERGNSAAITLTYTSSRPVSVSGCFAKSTANWTPSGPGSNPKSSSVIVGNKTNVADLQFESFSLEIVHEKPPSFHVEAVKYVQ